MKIIQREKLKTEQALTLNSSRLAVDSGHIYVIYGGELTNIRIERLV